MHVITGLPTVAKKKPPEPSEPRHPTQYWAGNFFSESMPAGPRDQLKSPTSPRGLQSLTKVHSTE